MITALAAQVTSIPASASTLNYACVPLQTCVWANFGLRSDGNITVYGVTATAWDGGSILSVGYLQVCETFPNSNYLKWCQTFPGTVPCGPYGQCQTATTIDPGYTFSATTQVTNEVVAKGTKFMAFWHTFAGAPTPNETGRWACLQLKGSYSVNC